MAGLVTHGVVREVGQMWLYNHNYSETDLAHATTVLSVTKEVYIDLYSLPQSMPASVWGAMGDRAHRVEMLELYHGSVGAGEVVRLLARVGRAELWYGVVIPDITAFTDSFVQEVGAEGGRCGELACWHSSVERFGAAVKGVAGRLGWRGGMDDKDMIVIKE